MDGRIDGWTDRWIDRWIEQSIIFFAFVTNLCFSCKYDFDYRVAKSNKLVGFISAVPAHIRITAETPTEKIEKSKRKSN